MPRRKDNNDLANVAAAIRADHHAPADPRNPQFRRQLVAEFCKLFVSRQLPPPADKKGDGEKLPPRLQQTLDRLLAGDSEKQIALHLGISLHTVHTYVKSLYRRFEVSSRGELLARWVNKR